MLESSCDRGMVVVISSVSGGGKTTLINELLKRHSSLQVATTATSRSPRPGEEDGVHYYFLSPEEFQRRIDAGEFLEHARVHGNFYGVPLPPVEEKLKRGETVLLNIDVQGMETVKRKLGRDVVTIFLEPPDHQEWARRLRERGTDSPEVIDARLKEGLSELKRAGEFDYRVVNDQIQRAVEELESILKEKGALGGEGVG